MNEFYRRHGLFGNAPNFLDLFKTETAEKELYLVAGPALVKIKLTAEKNESRGVSAISCTVTEIEGTEVPPEQQRERAERVRTHGRPPTEQEQMEALAKALQRWEFYDPPRRVSQSYVEGHLKAARLRQRIKAVNEQKGGNADVFG